MKKLLLAIFLLATMMLTSCIKIESETVMKDDFSATGTMVIDYATMKEMARSMDPNVEEKLPCDTYADWVKDQTTQEYNVLKCTNIDDNIASLDVDYGNMKEDVIEKNWVFLVEMTGDESLNNWEEEQTKEELAQSMTMMKSMWLEMNFKYVVPAKIVDFNIWKVEGDTVSFTVYDLVEVEEKSYIIYTDKTDYKKEVEELKKEFLEDEQKLKTKAKYTKQLILSKNELSKTYKWRKYINLMS